MADRLPPGPLKLRGAVRHYEWGGFKLIPSLLGLTNDEARPFAELWIGAHPAASAVVEIGTASVPLDTLLAEAPEAILGAAACARFERRLPYLLKVLDARKMLSLQAHPGKRQAQEGFARENASGIRLAARNRNYKDANHKPEVHVALGEFWMLHGFRTLEEIGQAFHQVPELAAVQPNFAERLAQAGQDTERRSRVLRDLYAAMMTMPQERVDGIVGALIARLEAQASTDKDSVEFWVLRAAREFPLPDGHRDRGILCIFLLNLVHLHPGQGTFQPAGVLHAYLEGANMELMANSDNVLRGGLTPKHVDVDELMHTLVFEGGAPEILEGEPISATETVYRTPAEEFELSRLRIDPKNAHTAAPAQGPHSLIVLEGEVSVTSDGRTVLIRRGEAALIRSGACYVVSADAGRAVLFKASIPAGSHAAE